MNIGDRIKLYREAAGLSQAELAKRVGYTNRTTISKIECGINNISVPDVDVFAKALNVTPQDLLGFADTSGEDRSPQMSKTSTFSERLKTLLRLTGYNQSELADACGINKSNITRYLTGKYKAKQDVIYPIAVKLNINPAWLMGYDVPMGITPERETNNQRKEPKTMGLGNRIKAYRKAAKLTQTELGAAAGVGKSAVCMIENGNTQPSLKVLKAFAGRLGVAVEDLLGENTLDPGDLSEAHIQILTALNYLSDEQAEILLNVMKALGMAWE